MKLGTFEGESGQWSLPSQQIRAWTVVVPSPTFFGRIARTTLQRLGSTGWVTIEMKPTVGLRLQLALRGSYWPPEVISNVVVDGDSLWFLATFAPMPAERWVGIRVCLLTNRATFEGVGDNWSARVSDQAAREAYERADENRDFVRAVGRLDGVDRLLVRKAMGVHSNAGVPIEVRRWAKATIERLSSPGERAFRLVALIVGAMFVARQELGPKWWAISIAGAMAALSTFAAYRRFAAAHALKEADDLGIALNEDLG